MREISRPRLKAWLNIIRVWKVETNGNHEQSATGRKMSIPIPASNSLARDRTDFHIPSRLITGFQAHAIYKQREIITLLNLDSAVIRNWRVREKERKLTERIPHPVGINANMLANMSVTDKLVSTIATTIPARAINKETPCINLSTSWKLTDIFWLKVKT